MRKGFTLIELLVVIAIIAILAAILFPVFARARAKAQQNNCLSNVKQMQLGLIMYASDNNQMYPLDVIGGGTPTGPAWSSQILPYIKNAQIFICPSDTIVTGTIGTTGSLLPGVGNTVTLQSYGRNEYINVGGNPGTNTIPIADSLIQYPAEMLGIMDAVQYIIPCGNDTAAAGGSTATSQMDQASIGTLNVPVTVRHNNGCNQSYMDGHVKWIAYTNIYDAITTATASSAGKHYWWGKD